MHAERSMETRRADPDHAFRATLLAVAAVAVVFSVDAYVRVGAAAGASTLMGGATAVLNLLAMRRILGNLVAGVAEGDNKKTRRWGALSLAKLLGLYAGVAVLLAKGIADAVPFLFGYVALPVGM